MQSPISRLDFTFCLGEQVIHQISRTRYTAPPGGTLAPPPSPPRHRPCYIHLCPASGMDDTHDLSSRCLIPLNLGAGCRSVVLIALIVANTTECTRKAFYNPMSIKVHKNRLETKLMIKYAK